MAFKGYFSENSRTKELIEAKNSEWYMIEKLQMLPPRTEIILNNLISVQDK